MNETETCQMRRTEPKKKTKCDEKQKREQRARLKDWHAPCRVSYQRGQKKKSSRQTKKRTMNLNQSRSGLAYP